MKRSRSLLGRSVPSARDPKMNNSVAPISRRATWYVRRTSINSVRSMAPNNPTSAAATRALPPAAGFPRSPIHAAERHQRIVRQGRAIRLIRPRRAEERVEQALDHARLDVVDDEHDARAPVVVGPGIELDRRMEDVLDA